jgi:trimeric autotransporter adhesin
MKRTSGGRGVISALFILGALLIGVPPAALAASEPGVIPAAAAGPVPYMVKNIRPGDSSGAPNALAAVGSLLYFAANDGATGKELWRSDGTKAGTHMVADLNPGAADSYPDFITPLGSGFAFTAYDDAYGRELWLSDGTSLGTHRVDIRPGTRGSFPMELTAFGSYVYFSASDGSTGRELWRTDGITTERVADIVSGSGGSSPTQLTPFSGRLYFASGKRLWSTDGTVAGTALVKDANGRNIRVPRYLTVSGGLLYFSARTNDGTTHGHLWRADGTAAGTRSISPGMDPLVLTDVRGELFFTEFIQVGQGRLWKSDGTKVGTVVVAETGSNSQLTAVGSYVYFTSYTDDGLQRLMVSNGTAEGTDGWLAAHVDNGSYINNLTEFRGLLHYVVNGYLMYDTCPSDCAEHSWAHLADLDYESSSVWDDELTVVGRTLFYSGSYWDGSKGIELWAYTP